ncbi:MAG: UDP-N-acetylmuramate--L-alanine ligase [Rickettsiales bacterium]
MYLPLADTLSARVKNMHFIGVGGIGMSGVAEILQRLGYSVSGSDAGANYNTKRLERLGVTIFHGHDAAHVAGKDIVVYSSAIPADNPELVAARGNHIPVISRAEMLAELMRFRHAVAIAGSHGKTTTTTIVSSIFEAAGLDPTVVNGGVINRHESNAYLGKGDWFIAESDESDGSFLRLPATVAIVTNIDPEHLEHYGDFNALLAAFRQFIEKLPFYGFAVLCADHPETAKLAKQITSRRIVTYGFDESAAVRADNVTPGAAGSRFDVFIKGEKIMENVAFAAPGRHNVLNCLAAIAAASELGIECDAIRAALQHFKGVKRRFTVLGTSKKGVTVVDDYAHHPEEIKATLAAAKAVIKSAAEERGAKPGRVVAIFEPHRYSRVNALFREFAKAFDDADLVLVKDIYPAGEKPIDGITREALVEAIAKNHKGTSATVYSDAEIIRYMQENGRDGDMALCMGAGPVTVFAQRLHDALANENEGAA